MKPGEIREKSPADILKMSTDLEEEVFRLKFRRGGGNLKQTANIKKTRKDLARVKTVLRESELKAQGDK